MNRSDRDPKEGSRGFARAHRHLAAVALLCLAACGGGGGGGGGNGSNGVTAPTFLVQPQAVTVADGQPANFGTVALGTAPLTYQWSRDGAAIAGATAANYALPAATLADGGANFTVVVSGPGGTTTSNAARLTVTAVAPRITNDRAQTVEAVFGQAATLTVTATGSAPLTYQWRRAGTIVAGATAATYVTPATTRADQGAVYDVVIANAAGSVTSSPFTLSITNLPIAPAIVTQPMSVTVRAAILRRSRSSSPARRR